MLILLFFFSSRRRHTRCALVTGVQTCALPICCNMASAFGPRLWRRTAVSVPPARSLGRRMTWHAAAALLAFAALQIWLVMSVVAAGAPSAFIVVALVMLLALALPVARSTERHRPEEPRGGEECVSQFRL